MWHYALVSCTPSQSIGLLGGTLFWCWVSLCVIFYQYLYMVLFHHNGDYYWTFMFIMFTLDYTFRLSDTRLFWFCNYEPPWVILLHSLEYWIEYVTFRPLYVMRRFSNGILYRGVPGFATDCPCSVWCGGLTNCFQYAGAIFGNLVGNEPVGLQVWHYGEQLFHCF